MKQRYIEIPNTWDELTEADWRELLKIRQKVVNHGGRYSELDITTETARILLKNRGVKLQLNNQNYILLVGNLAKTLGWLWHAEGNQISLVYKTTWNRLPKVRDWYGPLDHGADIMFGEFRMAVGILKQYEQQPDEIHLNVLAGLLYRPEATKKMQQLQQLRLQPYDWDDFDAKKRRGEQMQRWQVWGIYAWFAYFCEYLTTGVFTIDGVEVCFAPLFGKSDSTKKSGSNAGSLIQICHTLGESGVFGTAKDVDHTPLMNVMQKLLSDYYALKRLQKK